MAEPIPVNPDGSIPLTEKTAPRIVGALFARIRQLEKLVLGDNAMPERSIVDQLIDMQAPTASDVLAPFHVGKGWYQLKPDGPKLRRAEAENELAKSAA